MTVGSNVIKATAKTALKGNMVKAIISSMVLIFCSIFNYYMSSLTGVFGGNVFSEIFFVCFSALMIFPLMLGVLRFFWRMILGCDDSPISVFYYFSSINSYLKTIKFLFAIFLKLLPIAIVLFLPAIFVWLLSQSFLFDFLNIPIPLWSRNLEYAIIFTKTLSTVLLILLSLRYYISPVLFVADKDIDVWEALHMSSVVSKKTSLDFIYLFFSFTGWILLSVFVMPLVYTLPYMLTAFVVHSRFSIVEYNSHIENVSEEKYPSYTIGA